jgi:hypothetical protein
MSVSPSVEATQLIAGAAFSGVAAFSAVTEILAGTPDGTK